MNFLYRVLPLSPFQPYIQQLSGLPFLGYLNWFFPIGTALEITATWLSVIGVYYTYMAILRWLKVLGS